MAKIIIIIFIVMFTSCEHKSSNRELTNRMIRASYKKGWYDGVARTINNGFDTSKDVKEGYIVDSLKFESLIEW